MKQLEETLKARGGKYGDFGEMAEFSQRLKSMIITPKMSYAQREAMGMIATKIARLVCGDCNDVDGWHDVAGYATLAEKELMKTQMPTEDLLGHATAVARR